MLKIEIHGDVGEGKTTVAAIIAHYLQFHGFRIEMRDDGLPNREALKKRIEQIINTGVVGQGRVAAIDVDNSAKAP